MTARDLASDFAGIGDDGRKEIGNFQNALARSNLFLEGFFDDIEAFGRTIERFAGQFQLLGQFVDESRHGFDEMGTLREQPFEDVLRRGPSHEFVVCVHDGFSGFVKDAPCLVQEEKQLTSVRYESVTDRVAEIWVRCPLPFGQNGFRFGFLEEPPFGRAFGARWATEAGIVFHAGYLGVGRGRTRKSWASDQAVVKDRRVEKNGYAGNGLALDSEP